MTQEEQTLIIRFAGDSGDGVQLMGEQLTITAALSGRDVRTFPDFPAEIRAPSGTLGGVSGFQLAMSEGVIFTAGETLDVLVAFNPAALKKSLAYLKEGGLLILNEDHFKARDFQKANASEEELLNAKEHFQVLSFPITKLTEEAVSNQGLTLVEARKAKNFFVLGLLLWLFDLPVDPSLTFIQKKFKNKKNIALGNELALKAGFNHAMTLELSRADYILGRKERAPGDYRQITGIEAVALALATIAVKTKSPLFVAGYPITPASGILHECAKLEAFGLKLFQAEDEIAAACSALGAAFGGRLSFCCTSGPGFDLKAEALGLAVMTELPLVVVNVQRAGASTGLPTKTSQSDLLEACFGRHGEAPLPVIAALSPEDCFETIVSAFKIAVTYMTPVVVLLDAWIANAAEPWRIPNLSDISVPELKFNRAPLPYTRDEKLARSWNIPGSEGFIHQIGGLEKQGEAGKISYDAANHREMVALRAQKVANIRDSYPPLLIEGSEKARTLVIGWGSTQSSLRAAILQCENENLPLALLCIRHVYPLPKELGTILQKYERVIVAELNSGQLCQMIRAQFLVDARSLTECDGQPFSLSFLVKNLKQECGHDTCLEA